MQKVAGTGLAALAGGFGGAAIAGVQFNAQMEQYTTTFEVFTKSAEKANEVLNDLQQMGAKTPFEFTDLADATTTLMAFGFTADEAIDSLEMLGNASQGNADKLDTITKAFARMSSSGKVSLEDLNMMIDVGFNPLQQVAENAGITMGEVYDKISKGEISVEQVTEAMQQMTSEGGQYFGLMDAQSETLNGRLSTLSDTVQMKLGEATQFLFDQFSDLLPAIISFIENLDLNTVYNGILLVSGALGGLFTAITLVRGAIALFQVTTYIQSLGGLTSAIGMVTAGIGTVLTAIAPVVAVITAVIAVIALVTATITQLWNTSETFRQSVIEIINNISNTLNNIWVTIVQPILTILTETLVNVYNNGIKPLWDQWVAFVGVFVQKVNELWTTITPVLAWFVNTFGPMLVAVFELFMTTWQTTINVVLQVAGQLLANLSTIVSGIIDVIRGIVDFLVGVFTGDWKLAWNGVQTIFNGFKQTIDGISGAIKNIFNGIINFVKGGFMSAWQSAWNSVKSIFTGIWNSLSGVVSSVWSNILGLFSNGGQIFNGVVNGISKVFRTIVNNLISGINRVIATPFNTINGILNGIRNISVLGAKPFAGLWSANPLPVPRIPTLQRGGVLEKGQVGLLEGNGAEAVVPLDRNKAWIRAVAKDMLNIMPQVQNKTNNQTVNFYQPVETADQVARALRLQQRYGLAG